MTDTDHRPDDDLYDVPAVARKIGFSEEYVRRKIRSGELGSVRFGYHDIRVRPSQLEAFIAELEQRS